MATATDFVEQEGLLPHLERVLNAAALAKQPQPLSHMARLLAKEARPTVLTQLHVSPVLDNRSQPTFSIHAMCNVLEEEKRLGTSTASQGTSVGSFEVQKEAQGSHIQSVLSDCVVGIQPQDQRSIDEKLITLGLGSSITGAASIAIAQAGASIASVPLYQHLSPGRSTILPVPVVTMLSGGRQGIGKLKFESVSVMPRRGIAAAQGIHQCVSVSDQLQKALSAKFGLIAGNSRSSQGGFISPVEKPDDALGLVEEAIRAAGFKVGEDIYIGIDCASNSFFNKEAHKYEMAPTQSLSSEQMVDFYAKLVDSHPGIVMLEDAMEEEDHEGWAKLVSRLSSRVLLCGDDVTASSATLIEQAVAGSWLNGVQLNVSQAGSCSRFIDAAKIAHDAGWHIVVSHRSGQGAESDLVDLAVAVGAAFLKGGGLRGCEHMATYNRLMEIHEAERSSERPYLPPGVGEEEFAIAAKEAEQAATTEVSVESKKGASGRKKKGK